MTTSSTTYVIRGGLVVYDIIDDEAVVVHLGTGAYYSFRGLSLEAWSTLTTPQTNDQVAAVLAPVTPGTGNVAAEQFLGYLTDEDLVDRDGAAAPPVTLTEEMTSALLIEKYTDVQELLTVDPVHDVDERGWPAVAPAISVE